MGKRKTPPPPEILRKSGPQKDRSKYDRKRAKEQDRRRDSTEEPPSPKD
ncbi:MAG: hypothetical protein JSV45_15140 [Chromatiales bacterium]|nr:MAG: hypothetical protein JSV45_15140 [Chromatiales bacterium]